jgi:hypothetical protein
MTADDRALSDTLLAVEAVRIKPARPIDLRAAALYYVTTLKWPVFPLKERGKTPLTPNGFQDASLDPAQIAEWWQRWPNANIGIPTGTTGCGYDVIDADGPEGVKAWTELKHRLCEPGCSAEAFCGTDGGFDIRAEAFTPGNATVGKGPGRHIFVPASPDARNGARIGDKPIDIRASGGYVVAVPSLNLNGAAYTWLTAPKVA